MDEGKDCSDCIENDSGCSNGRPPNPLSGSHLQSFGGDCISVAECKESIIRDSSLVSSVLNFVVSVCYLFFCSLLLTVDPVILLISGSYVFSI